MALKRLPPAHAADPERLERFHTEAAAVAKLQEFGVLPLYDIREVGDTPVLVMPYIDGPDLGRVIDERQALGDGEEVPEPHPLATAGDGAYLDAILPALDRLIDAVAATHAADILHRDIKPSNVLLDATGNPWLSDFGLAKLRDQPSITATGAWMGTPGFLSPEQWEGRSDLDARADLFSLAATIYQALTLQLPYGTSLLKADALTPVPPSRLQPLLPAAFDAVLLKALEPDRAYRYRTVEEFRKDWQRVREGLRPRVRRPGPVRRVVRRARRNPWMAACGCLAAAFLGVFGFFFPRDTDSKPADPTVYRTVRITTQPPGARVVLVPFNQYQELDPAKCIRPPEGQVTPLTLKHVPAGKYLVVAAIPGYGFHEVYRTVPDQGDRGVIEKRVADKEKYRRVADGIYELYPIPIVADTEAWESMTFFPGGDLPLNDKFRTPEQVFSRPVSPFYLETTEVTVGAYRKVMGEIPSRMVGAFPDPPPGFDNYAVRFVDFYQALDYAERVGRRLPTQFEYEYAATKGGTRNFPWGDDAKEENWGFGPVKEPDYDRTDTDPPVYGLYSNVAEWTDSLNWSYNPAYHPSMKQYTADFLRIRYGSRVLRGAPSYVIAERPFQQGDGKSRDLGPRWHQEGSTTRGWATVGFRCARSAGPRFLDQDPTPHCRLLRRDPRVAVRPVGNSSTVRERRVHVVLPQRDPESGRRRAPLSRR